MRLIDADALKQHYNVPDAEGVFSYCDTIMRVIDGQPTIEAEPVRHGRWIPYTKNRDENVTNVFQCSECEKTVRFIMAHKMCEYTFCPFCNAKMGGADNG